MGDNDFKLADIPVWLRVILSISLLSGGSAGIGLASNDSSDRYYGALAKKDFALRDDRIERCQNDLNHLHADYKTHQRETKTEQRDIKKRLRAVEAKCDK